MKEQIKIRKRWLINPASQIEIDKKTKQRFNREEDRDWNKYTGNISREDLEALENEEKG